MHKPTIENDSPKGGGCFNAVWTVFWTGAFLSTLLFCTLVVAPALDRVIAPAFCRGKVEFTGPKSIVCHDKVTGQRTYITHIHIISLCPTIPAMVFVILLWVIASSIAGRHGR